MAIDETVEWMNKKALGDIVLQSMRDMGTTARNLDTIRENAIAGHLVIAQAATGAVVQNLTEMDPRQAKSLTEAFGRPLPSQLADTGAVMAALQEILRPSKSA